MGVRWSGSRMLRLIDWDAAARRRRASGRASAPCAPRCHGGPPLLGEAFNYSTYFHVALPMPADRRTSDDVQAKGRGSIRHDRQIGGSAARIALTPAAARPRNRDRAPRRPSGDALAAHGANLLRWHSDGSPTAERKLRLTHQERAAQCTLRVAAHPGGERATPASGTPEMRPSAPTTTEGDTAALSTAPRLAAQNLSTSEASDAASADSGDGLPQDPLANADDV